MENIRLAFFAILPAMLLAIGFAAIVRTAGRYEKIVFALTLFHVLVLVTFPNLFSLVTGFQTEAQARSSVTQEELIEVLLGESVYVALFVIGFLCIRTWFRSRDTSEIRPETPPEVERAFSTAMIVFAWLLYTIPTVASATSIFVFDSTRAGSLNRLLGWIGSLFYIPSLVVCGTRVAAPWRVRYDWLKFLFVVIPLIALLFIGVTQGVRGRVTWVATLLIVGAYYHRNQRIAWVGLLLVAGFFPFATFFGSAYRPIYQTATYEGASRLDLARTAIAGSKEFAHDSNFVELMFHGLESLADRAQGTRNSVFLYREVEIGQNAGFKPILGSIEFPIPRGLWAGKLFPGSLSTDERDAAMYLVMEKGHGLTGYMGPIFSSAHAYWEGGWPWLLLTGFGLGAFWAILCRVVGKLGGVIGLTVLMSFLGAFLIDGLFTAIAPVYAIVLQIWKILIPVLLLKTVFPSATSMPRHSVPRRRRVVAR